MATPPPGPADQPSQGALQRILGVFLSPMETFADIARRPTFVAPLALLTASSLLASVLAVNRIGAETIVRQQIEKSSRGAEMSAEQKQAAVERSVPFVTFFTYAGPLLVPLGILIISGVLLGMVNFVFGAEASFPQMFGVVSHAYLPALLVSLLAVPIVLLKDPADLDVQNLVASNLGVAISADSSKILHRLAISLDLFSAWQIVLLAVGISAVSKFPFRKSLLAVLIPWAVYALGAAGLAAIH